MSSDKTSEEHPFYGYPIYRHKEQEYIQNILKKYKDQPVNEELKKKSGMTCRRKNIWVI